jgi:hypothetical protein
VNELRVDFEWRSFKGRDEPAINATFADLKISVGEEVVTRVLDRTSKTIRERIITPLYPLAEWLAAHWWPLFNEYDVPGRGVSPRQFQSRHAIRCATEGFPLPNLRVLPLGEMVHLEWRPYRSLFGTVEFLGRGGAKLPLDSVRQVFSDLIEAVLSRLDNQGIVATWLHEEWRAIQETTPDELEFCKATASLGLDPYEVDSDAAEKLIRLWESLPGPLRQDAFLAAPPERLEPTVEWLKSGLRSIREAASNGRAWKPLQGLLNYPPRTTEPWRAGYRLAREVRTRLHLGDVVPFEFDQLASDTIPILHAELPPGRSIDGLFGLANSASPCCYAAKSLETSQRFLLARGLIDFFTGRLDDAVLLSSAETQQQQLGRAFAAELLAPAQLIRNRLSGDVVTADEIDDLAADFNVSPHVIEHQVENHRLARSAI